MACFSWDCVSLTVVLKLHCLIIINNNNNHNNINNNNNNNINNNNIVLEFCSGNDLHKVCVNSTNMWSIISPKDEIFHVFVLLKKCAWCWKKLEYDTTSLRKSDLPPVRPDNMQRFHLVLRVPLSNRFLLCPGFKCGPMRILLFLLLRPVSYNNIVNKLL